MTDILDDDVEEISFEKLPNGKWEKVEDDPDDDESEIVTPVSPKTIYSQIENLKKKGWIVRQDTDPDFNGFILYKKREVQ
jgi:hypothetical protein